MCHVSFHAKLECGEMQWEEKEERQQGGILVVSGGRPKQAMDSSKSITHCQKMETYILGI